MEPLAFALFSLSSLFAVVDPLGCIPFFSGQTQGMDAARKRSVLLRALVVSLVLLVLFTLAGGVVLHTFGITVDAFRIAGGVIFFGIGLDMMQSKPRRWRTGLRRAYAADHPESQLAKILLAEDEDGAPAEVGGSDQDPSVTPLAIPMLAGPGSITTVMVLRAEADGTTGIAIVLGALLAILVLTGIILWTADVVLRRIGQTGMKIVEKLMGLVVTVIAVQFMLDGLEPWFTRVLGGN